MTGDVGINLSSGVHAYATREFSDRFREHLDQPNFMAYSGSDMRVCGEVSLWGRVIRSERGYQAEKAYPRRLFFHYDRRFTFDLFAALRREYGVEVDELPEVHGKA
jgi:hypothetical protein